MRILILIISISLFSCSKSVKDRLEDISDNSDKMEIFFYNGKESNIDDKSKIIVISQRSEIDRIMNFVADDDTPNYKCGYSGSLKFYKNNIELLEMEFNIEVQCNHFSFIFNNEIYFKGMTPEGRSYLEDMMLNPDDKSITQTIFESHGN